MEFALDLMQTTALAMIFFLLGRVIVAHVEFLRRVCIPAPVVGGLVFALIHLALHSAGVVTFTFDETLKNAFMIWFFTSVGYGASFKVLARGIKPVLVFLGCMITATAIELATSYILEALTGAWPWQTYRDYAINFEGRIALSPPIRFGLGGLLFLYVLQPLFRRLVHSLSPRVRLGASIAVAVLLAAGCAFLLFR